LESPTDREKLARKACEAFIARTTVLLLPRHDPRREPESVGSGVLLQNARGVPFLVTASHLFRDDQWQCQEWLPLTLFAPALGVEMRDAGVEVTFAPGRTPEKPVDVALMTIRGDLHDGLRPLAAGIEQIAENDVVNPQDVLFLSGFPTFLSFRESASMRRFATITYATGVTGRDQHGRLEVYWDEAIPTDDAPRLPHLEVQPGKPMALGSPGGISGGGLWRVRGSKKGDLIWSPSSHATLVGIPVAFIRPRTEYAESAVAWGPWLRIAAERLV
jgi:hypothetical protein